MELSRSAQEVITQAQMLRLKTDSGNLSLEHIYYGLLVMASYLDEPMNGTEFREEAVALRKYLESKSRSIESMKRQLHQDAADGGSMFTDARPILGRAAEMAGEKAITPMDLARAIHENPSPTIRALNGLINRAALDQDARYAERPAPVPPRNANTHQSPNPVRPPVKPPVKPDRPPVKPPVKPEKPPVKPGEDVDRLVAAIQALDRIQGLQTPKKKRTKFGLLTYRGGKAAAALQYFLLVLLIPLGILFGLQHFTGYVCTPPSPLISMAVRAFVLIWGFLLLRGIAHLTGYGSRAFSLFLRILLDIALLGGLVFCAKDVFAWEAVPAWMRYTASALVIVILSVGISAFELKKEPADRRNPAITYGLSSGRTGKVMFQSLTRNLLLPSALVLGVWSRGGDIPDWAMKAVWILVFISVWSIPVTVLSCLAQRSEKRRGGARRVLRFFQLLVTLLILPALVLFLHWLFAWQPIRLWVLIALGVYSVFSLIIAIVAARGR